MKNYIYTLLVLLSFVGTVKAQYDNSLPTEPNKKIKVFPNPATNIINVLGFLNSMNAIIIVSDVYGNSVLKHHWEVKNNALNIPIANLKKGIYLISIVSKEQHVQTKFYKQ